LDGLVHTVLILEADESLRILGVFRAFGDFTGKYGACRAKLRRKILGLSLVGQVLDHHIELVHDFGLLDLPHQAELLAVEALVILVGQGPFSFFDVGEVEVAEA